MAELVDALALGASTRKGVGVRVSLWAQEEGSFTLIRQSRRSDSSPRHQ